MLKALELIGFKSFADKTRFEFPAGITVIVGPNGSGKSNIVDAIKWVLGEQSAKSLRGKEMIDVIFKGSGGAGGRRPMNMAEATIIIDNEDGKLPIDAPEVHVTRRVYRSGEGEYLINREPCRLRDIRDLFRGTGVGTDSYSLIEQGKVDQMLQASARERRAMFEEAAGISRFKAKKIETERRLERVEQNLLRLSDIVEEVDNRLRRVRSQAAKARRYKECSDRLRQLRTTVGFADWQELSSQLETTVADILQFQEQAAAELSKVEIVEKRILELESESSKAHDFIRSCESKVAQYREHIAKHESTIKHQRVHSLDIEEEQSRCVEELTAMNTRAGDLQDRLREMNQLLETVKQDHDRIKSHLDDQEATLQELDEQLASLRTESDVLRKDYVERTRLTASLDKQVNLCQTRKSTAQTRQQRLSKRTVELTRQLETLSQELHEEQNKEQLLKAEVDTLDVSQDAAQTQLTLYRRQKTHRQDEFAQFQARYSGASERATILEELEARLEGFNSGVQEVLNRARSPQPGPFIEVRGVVADLIQANVEIAPLVDIALGERTQYVVLEGDQVIDLLQREPSKLDNRVGFICLSEASNPARLKIVDLQSHAGVVGRIDQLIDVQNNGSAVILRLLGCTWVVESLAIALALSKKTTGQRFVSLDGALIEDDGTFVVGAKQLSAGLVSRRSELVALRSEIKFLAQQLVQIRQVIDRLGDQIDQQERTVRQFADQQKQVSTQLSDARVATRTLQDLQRQLTAEQNEIEEELQQTKEELQHTESELHSSQTKLSQCNAELQKTEERLKVLDPQCEKIEEDRSGHQNLSLAAKVQLAKMEQRLESLHSTISRLEADQRERTNGVLEMRSRIDAGFRRKEQLEVDILQGSATIAKLYLEKEACAHQVRKWNQQLELLAGQRSQTAAQALEHRGEARKFEDLQHQKELAAGEIRHKRGALADRLRDDYGIEISELKDHSSQDDDLERSKIEEEINSLRRKINNIGAVNVEALNEMEELEERFTLLSSQYQDLNEAKELLERILQRINTDSRRLFTETLEQIRVNFQVLYRKAFGGGKADIVLEEGVDVLEAGVEILATPPGKPQFNNSLLSGGEKALTAVSLLLAIFQHRPSPFCVLDEVDAPFDEANIDRFMNVLREFLGWTKFVIVTHSKKTMTSATTLYGVTMQESGISKRVSVKFDDVSEDGHITKAAIERTEGDEATENERGVA